ncbi:MAG: (2Fe-2S) ferredoxin domain-containing protein [Mariprofundus sp.]
MSRTAAIGICHGPICADYGGRKMAAALQQQGIEVIELPCQSLCLHAPVARVDGIAKLKATTAQLQNDLHCCSV